MTKPMNNTRATAVKSPSVGQAKQSAGPKGVGNLAGTKPTPAKFGGAPVASPAQSRRSAKGM